MLHVTEASAGIAFELARQHHAAGDSAQARVILRQILDVIPSHGPSLILWGVVLSESGKIEEGLVFVELGISHEQERGGAWPANEAADALHSRGRLYECLNRHDEAIADYRRAVELNPTLPQAYNQLGMLLRERGQLADAVKVLRRAVEAKPDYADAWNNLAIVYRDLHEPKEAIFCYAEALKIKPHGAELHNNLANVLRDCGMQETALGFYKSAVDLRPEYIEAHANMGITLFEMARHDEAVSEFRYALLLAPEHREARRNLLFSMQFMSHTSPAQIREEHERWNVRHAKPLAMYAARHENSPDPDRPLRIGYVSPDFRDHCQAFFTVPLLSSHDHERYQIYLYADRGPGGGPFRMDPITERIRKYADVWVETQGMSDEAIAERIRADQIDVLIDLTMHMAHGRLPVFARKPAPVQIAWLAYPGTTGVDAIEYRISDPWLDPPGEDEEGHDAWYVEKTLRVESFWCYHPLTTEPAVNALPALSNGHMTFGCLNNFAKVTDETLVLWRRVLERLPNSKLILLAPMGSARDRVMEQMGGMKGVGERIEFVDRAQRPIYLQRYSQIDLCLDTFPYNGHTTSLDALWMGVPSVTLCGEMAVSRAGLSQLSNLGMAEEFVAYTPGAYIELAARWANDLEGLAEIRAGLRARMESSVLMDGRAFARRMEEIYRETWKRWCNSKK